LFAALALSASVCATEGFEIPVVPCDLLAGGCADGVRQEAQAPSTWPTAGASPMIRTVARGGTLSARATPAGLRPASMELGPKTVTAAPGTTVLLEIAIGHLNRIVTPFEAPVVHTVSSASTQVEGSVVYVATDSPEPISLFVADGRGGADALSLTLAPRYVPPREIRLSVPGRRKVSAGSGESGGGGLPTLANAESMSGVSSGPSYTAGIVELLRGMAQGRVPTGFTVRKGSGDYRPRCADGLKLRKTQLTVGAVASVVTAAVSNASTGPLVVGHQSCTIDGHTLAATAAWPRKELAPGEDTEIFLVLAHGERMADPTGRPR
jgi:conjugal transfer pilus assembly protein TraK